MKIYDFTATEGKVLQLLAQGLDHPSIAERLGIKQATVRGYATTIYSKLGVHNRLSAVLEAQRLGLIEQAQGESHMRV